MEKPHLTPSELFGAVKLPEEWASAKIAIICFTPYPTGFDPYVIATSSQRYFLHSPTSEVRLCKYYSTSFIVISEVYGFAVGATTVEELVHYGIKYIIGLGYIGAFNGAPVGSRFIAEGTISDLPIAVHYGVKEFKLSKPTENLQALLKKIITKDTRKWGHNIVWNSNSLYRESDKTVDLMKGKGCEVVNMDTLSVFAATHICNKELSSPIECVYVGTVTDSSGDKNEDWDSNLNEAVTGSSNEHHNNLVTFIVENILTEI